jgi:hypothetical protein
MELSYVSFMKIRLRVLPILVCLIVGPTQLCPAQTSKMPTTWWPDPVKASTPLADLNFFKGRLVYIMLDANAETNRQVKAAREALVKELLKLNCTVLVADGSKTRRRRFITRFAWCVATSPLNVTIPQWRNASEARKPCVP